MQKIVIVHREIDRQTEQFQSFKALRVFTCKALELQAFKDISVIHIHIQYVYICTFTHTLYYIYKCILCTIVLNGFYQLAGTVVMGLMAQQTI